MNSETTKPSTPVHAGCYADILHDDGEPVQDLYLLDSLLLLMVDHDKGGWAELEKRYNATWRAIRRLRQAFESGEMERITMSLAEYFRDTPSA